MRNIVFILLFFMCASAPAQSLLQGYVTAPDIALDSIQVVNQNRHTYVLTSDIGYFKLTAEVHDTLHFRHPHFAPQIHVVKKSDFAEPLILKLTPTINKLREVTVNGYVLSGNLATDSKNIILVEEFQMGAMFIPPDPYTESLSKTKPLYIETNPKMESELTGVNLIMIGSAITKALGIRTKRKKEGPAKSNVRNYIISVLPPEYLTSDLKISADKINLFLEYCDARIPIGSDFTNYSNHLHLLEFLDKMAKEFNELNH